VKRHTKASQANSTPVTDGRRVVAIFGSIGLLAAWDMEGKPLWTTDVGIIDSGWFFEPDTQWGHSSSPIIHGDNVILQNVFTYTTTGKAGFQPNHEGGGQLKANGLRPKFADKFAEYGIQLRPNIFMG
jgi:hypothetical protein